MACHVSPRQEGVVPLQAAPLVFLPGAGGGPTGVRHLPSPLQPLCAILPNSRLRHDILRRQLHFAGLLPTRCLWLPPPIDPAEQLIQRPYRSALSQLRSGHFSRLQSYRHSVGWADDPTCPDCRSTIHTVGHLFSCPTHPADLAPGNKWTVPLQVAQYLAGLPQFSDLPPLRIDFDSFRS